LPSSTGIFITALRLYSCGCAWAVFLHVGSETASNFQISKQCDRSAGVDTSRPQIRAACMHDAGSIATRCGVSFFNDLEDMREDILVCYSKRQRIYSAVKTESFLPMERKAHIFREAQGGTISFDPHGTDCFGTYDCLTCVGVGSNSWSSKEAMC
jgi:hypothetical protein